MLNSSAKVTSATVVVKGRVLSFSMAAFRELELSLALFEKAQENPVINHALVRWSTVIVSALVNLYNPIQPSLKKLQNRARDVLFGDPSPDYTSSSRREDETESSGHLCRQLPQATIQISQRASRLLLANLFHDLVMRQIHGSKSKGQESTPEQVPTSQDLRPAVDNHPLSSWINPFTPEAQAQYRQTAIPVATHNDAPSTSDFFMPPSSGWTMPAEESTSAGMDYGVFMSHLGLSFNAVPNAGNSNGGPPTFDYAELGFGSSLGMNVNSTADGYMDWITLCSSLVSRLRDLRLLRMRTPMRE